MKRIARNGIYPALALVVALAAALAWGLGSQLAPPPAAEAQEYRGFTRVARIALPDAVVAYPGTNTNIAYQLLDADGERIVHAHWLHEAGITWAAANDAARNAVDDIDGFGSTYGGYLWIPFKADVRPGVYDFTVSTRDRNAARTPDVTAKLAITIAGPPSQFRAYLNKSSYRPGDSVTIRATALDENGNQATFLRSTQYGHGLPLACRDCAWAAADGATADALTAASGSLGSGRAGVRIASDAAGGDYTISVSHPQIATRELRFTVISTTTPTPTPGPGVTPTPTPDPGVADPPASYTLSDGDEIAAGATAAYTVTARSATGGVPNLEGDNGQVYVVVDGAGAGSVTITGAEASGRVALNEQGAGTFGLMVSANTAPTSISLEIVGAVAADPVVRQVSVGSVPPPQNVGAVATVDDQGDATTVTMTWVPGSGTNAQVAVVVNANDDTDYCLQVLPVDANSYTCTGRTPGATYVGLIIGLLPDGGYTLGNIVTIMLPAS